MAGNNERKKKINPTITKGVAKVPVIMQLEALECGAASLAMIMGYYGKWVPLEQVRIDCGVSRDGSKAKNIYLAAQRYGFDVRAFKMEPRELQEDGQFPCIIHWEMNHFVVLNGFKGKYAYVNDPAQGARKITLEQFDESFTGIVILPVPSDSFEPSGKRKSSVSYAKKRLVGAGAAVLFVALTTALTYMFGFINAAAASMFVDRFLLDFASGEIYIFVLILLLLALIQIVVAWGQAIYSLKISGKMEVIGDSSYMWKLLRLPMSFFSQRLSGDIQSRRSLNASIVDTLVNTLAPLVLNTVMMIFYLVLMLKQSLILTAIGIAAVILNVFAAQIVSKRRINFTRIQMRDEGMLDAATVTAISMIETIKASGAEKGFFRKWAGYQASVNTMNIKINKNECGLGLLPTFFADVANYAVLAIGVWLTMQGRFSLGSILMFQGFLTSFMQPANSLIDAGHTIQELWTQIDRVEDVMNYAEDPGLYENPEEGMKISKLKGNIELKNVTFGYSRFEKPLVEDFSISIKAGQRIALVGASGCGKSTISKLLAGLYQPWSGEILFDGKPRQAYPREIMTGSLAVIDQDIIMFEDTIENNIKMWDDSIEDFEVILAARDAKIHNDIMALSDGYRHKLISSGKNLSGGQRQRIEIARALAQDPTIVILDEATSALDAKTESEVVQAIQNRGITCIVIAHRLSTVRDCDEIIVLDHGKISERGTHEELMETGGIYAELIANE